MGIHSKQGFTIIETMLVLAITGLLVATLFVGVGGSINKQRYQDSVTTFKTTLQSQFTQVNNVTNVNSRTDKWSCGTSAVTSPATAGAGLAPGQSDCVLLGRYVSVVNDTITTAAVVGYKSGSASTTTDVDELKTNYSLGISNDSVETTTLEWGAAIAWPKTGPDASVAASPRSIGMLILKSPTSGTIYTFTSNTVDTIANTNAVKLKAMMVASNSIPGQKQRFVCVDPSPGSDGLTVPEKLAVVIDQGATDTTSIETQSYAVSKSLNGGVDDNTKVTKC